MKRGYYTAQGVVLNSLDYGESDRIISFYTHEYGKISGIAKGARRSKRRFVGNLDPLSRLRLKFFHPGGEGLARVESVTLLEAFDALKADIDRYGPACYMLELTSEMTRDLHSIDRLFPELIGFLTLLTQSDDTDSLLRFFEIKLLTLLGFLPHLHDCVMCRKEPDEAGAANAQFFFSPARGGGLCRSCAAGVGHVFSMSVGTAKFLTMASRLELGKLPRLVPGPLFVKESSRILQGFIEYQLGKELKTKKFIDKMKQASAAHGV